jgi:hypothetical protein
MNKLRSLTFVCGLLSTAASAQSVTDVGGMKTARAGHAATLLISGKVLVTGGGNGKADPTAELYDPASRTFSSTAGNMTQARVWHTATLLKLSNSAATNYGKVLVVGSVGTSAELYNPSTNTFVATGSLHHARTSPTATLLKTGKVLIVGGNTTSGDLVAELYNPASGTFSDTGRTTTLRTGHTATLLLDGRVLIAGGGTDTAELYNPSSGAGTFTATAGVMSESRSGHTATLLGAADGVKSGHVLIIGTDGSADLYDPSTQTFETVGNRGTGNTPIYQSTASLRSDGTVLWAGGFIPVLRMVCNGVSATGKSLSGAELFAPGIDGFTVTASLNMGRDSHTATVLQDASVLVVGGMHRVFSPPHFMFPCHASNAVLSSAELFR